MDMILTDRWGYQKDENGTYEGMVGLMQTRKTDTANGMLMKTWRMDHVDYCGIISGVWLVNLFMNDLIPQKIETFLVTNIILIFFFFSIY